MLLNDRIIRLLLKVTKANLGNIPTAPIQNYREDQTHNVSFSQKVLTHSQNVYTPFPCPSLPAAKAVHTQHEIYRINQDECEIESV